METVDFEADPLDVAYMAIGAHSYLRAAPEPRCVTNGSAGELDMISEVIAFAPLLAALWDEWEAVNNGEGFPGVWAYEVAEPFGEHLMIHMAQNREVSAKDAEQMARGIIAQCAKVSQH